MEINLEQVNLVKQPKTLFDPKIETYNITIAIYINVPLCPLYPSVPYKSSISQHKPHHLTDGT